MQPWVRPNVTARNIYASAVTFMTDTPVGVARVADIHMIEAESLKRSPRMISSSPPINETYIGHHGFTDGSEFVNNVGDRSRQSAPRWDQTDRDARPVRCELRGIEPTGVRFTNNYERRVS